MHLSFGALTTWLHLHAEWGGVAAFVVALAESLALIGTIIPGSVTMTAIGVLVGSGILPLYSTLLFAISGAVFGDSLSYAGGFYFKQRIQRMWPFRTHPQWLEHGKRFFERHGGTSVFLGRFIGPIRAMIPVIAGMLHMPPSRFFPVDILAAACWAPVYLLPGYLVGLASTALPADIATKLILLVMGLLVLFWLLAWIIKRCSAYTTYHIDRWLNYLWNKMLRSKKWRWCCRLLRDDYKPRHHGQFVLAFVVLIGATLSIILTLNVAFHGPLIDFNMRFYHLVRGFRNHYIDQLMIVISTLGQKAVLIPCTVIIAGWLYFAKKTRAAWHLIFAVAISAGIALFIRHLFHSPRPEGITFIKPSSSFPSGHVTLSTAFFGFTAWLLCLRKPRYKKYIYPVAFIIILLVALSRLYLGDHWLTDTIGGFLISLTCIVLVAIAYQNKRETSPHTMALLIITLGSVFIVGSIYTKLTFTEQMTNTQPVWLIRLMETDAWWHQNTPKLPIYRYSRLGQPAEFLNLQWMGNLTIIHHHLRSHGWFDLYGPPAKQLVKKLIKEKIIRRLDLIPALFEDQHPALVMFKQIKPHEPAIIIRLWPAHVVLQPQYLPLWIGSIHYMRPNKHLFFHLSYRLLPEDQIQAILEASLEKELWKIVYKKKNPVLDKLSREPRKNYSVLMIKPKPPETNAANANTN
jgi:membrane protein DedA with SNARE-associated domain/membrane-associated phospholipid phosphatase